MRTGPTGESRARTSGASATPAPRVAARAIPSASPCEAVPDDTPPLAELALTYHFTTPRQSNPKLKAPRTRLNTRLPRWRIVSLPTVYGPDPTPLAPPPRRT